MTDETKQAIEVSAGEAHRVKHRAAAAALFLVSVIWGSGFIMTELLINASWNTAQIMAARFTIGALALVLALGKNIRQITRTELKAGLIAGTMLFYSFYAQTLGQRETTVSNVAFFTATNVVMVPLFSWLINRERVHLHTIVLAIISFLGMAILSYSGGQITLNRGDLAILSCAVVFALHIIYLSKQLRYCDASRLNVIQIATAAVLSLSVWLATGTAAPGFDFRAGLWPILFLGLFSTCLCYFLQTKSQALVKASTVAVILALEGFFGALFALLLGMDAFSVKLVIGGLCIVGASILSNYYTANEAIH